jgi:hypothetical protein
MVPSVGEAIPDFANFEGWAFQPKAYYGRAPRSFRVPGWLTIFVARA